jgi:glycosyltransferase involved in cell wall biosynthesis
MEKKVARQNLIEELKLDQDVRFVGFVGRLARDKGLSSLIEAFKIISVNRPDLHVVLVGQGGDDSIDLLKKKAISLSIQKRIHFVGFHSNVWRFYRAMDCNVLPPKNFHGIPFEGVPQSILEAMASECPVVGSKSGGITDIIDHDKTGLLFDPEDSQDLAEKILFALEDKEKTKERIAAARKNVVKHYTIDTMGKNILRIYSLH